MSSHNRSSYDYILKNLQEDFLEVVSMVTKAFQSAMFALKTGNHFQAEQVIQRDKFVNARCYELEDSVLNVLTLQQPVVARDLRFVASMMLFASELERMGDYAKGIGQISLDLHAEGQFTEAEQRVIFMLEDMCQIALEQLRKAVDAFVAGDLQAARAIARLDDVLDAKYNEVNLIIINIIIEDKAHIQRAMRLNWAAHNIERLGDRVVNICERVVFVELGELAEF